MKTRVSIASALLCGCLSVASFAGAQTPAPAPAATSLAGTITAITGNTLTIKVDADGAHDVLVPSAAVLKRIAPGQKDLSTAQAIQFSDLAVGDRALVKLDPAAPAGTAHALRIIAMKQSDLALKQQQDRDDWQKRGVGGLVKSVDAAAGVIVLTSGSGTTTKTITIHTTKATNLKRYAPASVRFDEAKVAPIDAIHAGDQLRARGNKNADGTEIAAEDVISGGFRNIAGTIVSIDAAGSTIVVKDLTTKKPVTIHFTSETQLKRLPEMMARMLAMRLKGATGGMPSFGSMPPGGSMPQGGGMRAGGFGGGASADPQQMLSRAPAIQLGDLQKGEAVMMVSDEGTADATAITLLAGVEPLLEAPAASQNLLSNWSMGSGAGAAEAAAQ